MAVYSNRIVVSVSKTEVGLNITNSQSIPTQAGLQVMWQVPVSTLQARFIGLNSNLSNLRFLYNGYFVPAWLESINNGTATIWIKMPVSIPANSSIILNLYANPGLNFDGIYWGEAPQLSPTYGQYDNGANVFNFYDNFAGTSLNTNIWGVSGTVTINNGLSIKGSSTVSTIKTTSTFGSSVLDWYGYFTVPTGNGVWVTEGWNSGNAWNAWSTYNGQSSNYGYGYVTSSGSLTVTYTSISAGTQQTFSIANDGTNAHYMLNYINQSTIYAMQSTTNYIVFRNAGGTSGTGANVFVQWVRVHAYPPNGVMPSVELI